MAEKFDIPLVIYGENPAEDGNLIEENFDPDMDFKFFSTKNTKEILLGGVKIKDIMKQFKFNEKDFAPYIPPKIKNLKKKENSSKIFRLLHKVGSSGVFLLQRNNTGFRPNSERTLGTYSKYSSIDDKIDDFHWYTTYIKFGIGRATYDAYQEVRNEKITREEAVAFSKKI